MSKEVIDLVSSVAALVAAVGGLWAARAAHQSAVTAREATRHAENVERRGIFRDLIAAANGVIAESDRVIALFEEVKSEYRTLAVFTGNTGGSRVELYVDRADSKSKEVLPYYDEAKQLVEQQASLRDTSEEDLTQTLCKIGGYLITVQRIKAELEREVSSISGQNQLHRANRINTVSPHS